MNNKKLCNLLLEIINKKLNNKFQAHIQTSSFSNDNEEILIKCIPTKRNEYKIAKLLDISPLYLDIGVDGVIINQFDLELISKQYSFTKYLNNSASKTP